MKRPTKLVEALLHDASRDLDLSVERDIERIRCRSEHEGFSFLTITLPLLSDALERGLEAGTFTCPSSYSAHGSLPRFMGGFFKRVFGKDGRLLPEPCPYSIRWIRQICRFMKKLKIPCPPKRNAKAEMHFLEIEGELRRMTPLIEREDNVLDKVSRIIWPRVFPEVDYLDFVCHHGPGVTADRRLSNERHRISKWNHRSELTFPSDLHCYPNYGAAAEGTGGTWEGIERVGGIEYLGLRDELPVRVVFVPKTQTAPRVIAIEPSHMQFMQQSIKDYCYRILESHSLTKQSIRFTRQDVNQRLAYSSSIDKRLATLDLKDASDRVHLSLVQRIFKNSGILEYLEDSRSLHATLPSGRNIVLTKFASMGSALCFPVEAMVFYTLIQSAMHQLDGRRPSSRSVRAYSKQIDIYGDDIIVPIEYTDVVVRYLESYALKVNVNKSFRNSHFRESCGADYYNGIDVKPVYARTVPHDDLRHWGAEEILSWNATADHCYINGMWGTAQVIRTLLSRVVRRTIPRSREIGAGLAHFSYLFTTDLRWNRDLQCWKQKRLVYQPTKKKDDIDGDELACLNKWGQAVHARNRGNGGPGGSYQPGEQGIVLPGDGFRQENRSHCTSGMGPHRQGINSWECDRGVRRLQEHTDNEEASSAFLPTVATVDDVNVVGPFEPTRREDRDFSADYCLTEAPEPDPLRHLLGDISGLDFSHSTKRGSFKSKCRWVSLAG